jgi:hypothetical protein
MKIWKFAAGVAIVLAVLYTASWLLLPLFFSEVEGTAWTYNSPEHGFSLQLPSDDWVEFKRDDSAAAFSNSKHRVFFTAKVVKVTAESAFKAKVESMKKYLAEERGEFLGEPVFLHGVTEAGNPYAFWQGVTKSEKGGNVVVAQSAVWCKNKGLSVTILLEGELRMDSKVGRTEEKAYYDRTCKAICLSPM